MLAGVRSTGPGRDERGRSVDRLSFDHAVLTPGDLAALDRKIPVLEIPPTRRIEIAGTCDERDSDEYTLALGNRRAIAATAYLVEHGIAARRIDTIANGKGRPLDVGGNEVAWAMNRNDQCTVLEPGRGTAHASPSDRPATRGPVGGVSDGWLG